MLPLTHYIRIVRGIMLKGATLYDLQIEALALARPDAARHDAGRAPLPPHAGLIGPHHDVRHSRQAKRRAGIQDAGMALVAGFPLRRCALAGMTMECV